MLRDYASLVPIWMDWETRSACDLRTAGAWAYAEHPTTSTICGHFEVHGGGAFFWTPEFVPGFQPPGTVTYVYGYDWVRQLYSMPNVLMIAQNSEFDQAISEACMKLPKVPWMDTMALADHFGYPGSLDDIGTFFFGEGKNADGYSLMMKICKPWKGAWVPITPDVLYKLAIYNIKDVDIMRRFTEVIGGYLLPPCEREVYQIHLGVNGRGVALDVELCRKMIEMNEQIAVEAAKEAEAASRWAVDSGMAPTHLRRSDLTRVAYLQEWINAAGKPFGIELDDMSGDTLEDMERSAVVPEHIKAVLRARLAISRASIGKAQAALSRVSGDGRLRGQYRFSGARTARWTGHGVQLQNLPRPRQGVNVKAAVAAVLAGDLAALRVAAGVDKKTKRPNPPQAALTSMIRSMIVPRPGHKLVVGDFAQVEARMGLWLAQDERGMDEFRKSDRKEGPDPYCLMAQVIFARLIDKEKDAPERQIGKNTRLGAGYGMGGERFEDYAAKNGADLASSGVTGEQCIRAFRESNVRLVKLWKQYEYAIIEAIEAPGAVRHAGRCHFQVRNDILYITLPSGRELYFHQPRYGPARYPKWEDHKEITYTSYRKSEKGEPTNLFGGKILENIDQAACRDLQKHAMETCETEVPEWPLVMHTHDEIVLEVPDHEADEAKEYLEDALQSPPPWAEGFPLMGEVKIMDRYGK